MKTDFYKTSVLVTWAALFPLGAIVGGCGSSEPVASSTSSNTESAPPPSAPSAPGAEADSGSAPPAAMGLPAETGMDPAMTPGMEMGMDPAMTPGMEMGMDPTMAPGMDPAMAGEMAAEDPAMGLDDAAMGYGEMQAGGGYGGLGAGGFAGGSGQFGAGAEILVSSLAAASQIESTRFPSDYWGQAELAFKQGYEGLASELLYAHLATEPVAAAERYEQVRLSRALGRPTWVLRWGLSLSVRGANGYAGDTSPITSDLRPTGPGGVGGPEGAMGMDPAGMAMGEPGMGGLGMGGLGMGGLGAPGAPAAGANTPQAALSAISLAGIEEHLGLFATLTAENFDQRFAAGDYSPVFAALLPKPILAAPQSPAGGFAEGGPGMLAGDPALGMADPAMGMADPAMGMADPAMGMADAAMGMEDPAMGMGMGMGMGANARARAGEATVSTIAPLPQPHPRWRPGIVYLGELGYQEAIEAASEAGIDFLIHFDVTVEERRRTEEIVNETRARVVNVHSPGKQVGASRRLSNLDVKNRLRLRENASRENTGGAPAEGSEDIPRQMVAEALAPVFGAIDRELKLTEMPALSEAQVRARVGSLITSSVATPLEALAEFQLYRSLGLLTEEEMVTATELLMGDDGLRLLVGNESERREVLAELRPRLTAYGELGMEPPVAEPESNANRPPGRF